MNLNRKKAQKDLAKAQRQIDRIKKLDKRDQVLHQREIIRLESRVKEAIGELQLIKQARRRAVLNFIITAILGLGIAGAFLYIFVYRYFLLGC